MVGPGRRTSARRAFCSRSRSINGVSIADEKPATLLACQYTGKPAYRQDRSSVDLWPGAGSNRAPPRATMHGTPRQVVEPTTPRPSQQQNINKINMLPFATVCTVPARPGMEERPHGRPTGNQPSHLTAMAPSLRRFAFVIVAARRRGSIHRVAAAGQLCGCHHAEKDASVRPSPH